MESHSLCVFYTQIFPVLPFWQLVRLCIHVGACGILPLKLTSPLLILHHVCSTPVFVCLFPQRFAPFLGPFRFDEQWKETHMNQSKHEEEKTSEVKMLSVELTASHYRNSIYYRVVVRLMVVAGLYFVGLPAHNIAVCK